MSDQIFERTIDLLKLCHKLQSDKDGVNRPGPEELGSVAAGKTCDAFAVDIMQAISYVKSLETLRPLSTDLLKLGAELEAEGKIGPVSIPGHSRAALDYLLKIHGDDLPQRPANQAVELRQIAKQAPAS